MDGYSFVLLTVCIARSSRPHTLAQIAMGSTNVRVGSTIFGASDHGAKSWALTQGRRRRAGVPVTHARVRSGNQKGQMAAAKPQVLVAPGGSAVGRRAPATVQSARALLRGRGRGTG